jgi:hypothetical protein
VIVPQAEIDLVNNARLRRRMMRLPASSSPRAKCPLEVGGVYHLQPRLFAPSQAEITVVPPVRREPLDELTLSDARREGHGGVQGALEAWTRAHGQPRPGQLVWVVPFVAGDESEFVTQTDAVFLRRTSGYTTTSDQLSAGEVIAVPGAGEHARVVAMARRQAPQRAAIRRMAEDIETVQYVMLTMKARNRAKLIARELAKLQAELPVAEVVDSASSVELPANDAQSERDPGTCGSPLVVPLERARG